MQKRPRGGRSSVDPVVFFELQLLMFFEDVRSERRLIEVAADRQGLSRTDRVPTLAFGPVQRLVGGMGKGVAREAVLGVGGDA